MTTLPKDFDIKASYLKFLHDDPEMTMPVAAIEALVVLLSLTKPSTSSELITMVTDATNELKRSFTNSVSLTAGCDLFARFIMKNLNQYGNWETCREHLVANSRLFVQRAKQSREDVANHGVQFLSDGDVVLIHSFSRALATLFTKAAAQKIRFRAYVTQAAASGQGIKMANLLRSSGIPVCVIPDVAVGYIISNINKVFCGAEGVVETGGVINELGTCQVACVAKSANKPFYVVAESHKFVRLFPLKSTDLPTEHPFTFSTEQDKSDSIKTPPHNDFTPHEFVTALITDLGVLTTSGVSEELIKMWID